MKTRYFLIASRSTYAFMPVQLLTDMVLSKLSSVALFTAIRDKISFAAAYFKPIWSYKNSFFSAKWNIFMLMLCIVTGNSVNFANNTPFGNIEGGNLSFRYPYSKSPHIPPWCTRIMVTVINSSIFSCL